MLAWLHHSLENGDAILLVLAVLAVEALVVGLILKGKAGPILLGLLPGLCLVLALRASILDQSVQWIGFWITASLPAHLADLRNRMKAVGRR
jgi:hypothetical protein